MDHKYLSYEGLKRFFYTKILKLINLKIDKTNGDISNTKVRSVDTISTEFPDPIAGESTKTFLGKVKKCLADWKAIKSTLLTLSMLTNQYENSTSKIPTSALVYALKQSLDTTNSNLALKASISDLDAKTSYPKPTIGASTLSNTALNSHRVTSIVALSDISQVTYLPVQTIGILRTTSVGSYCTQEYFTLDKMYSRFYNGAAWSNWV